MHPNFFLPYTRCCSNRVWSHFPLVRTSVWIICSLSTVSFRSSGAIKPACLDLYPFIIGGSLQPADQGKHPSKLASVRSLSAARLRRGSRLAHSANPTPGLTEFGIIVNVLCTYMHALSFVDSGCIIHSAVSSVPTPFERARPAGPLSAPVIPPPAGARNDLAAAVAVATLMSSYNSACDK